MKLSKKEFNNIIKDILNEKREKKTIKQRMATAKDVLLKPADIAQEKIKSRSDAKKIKNQKVDIDVKRKVFKNKERTKTVSYEDMLILFEKEASNENVPNHRLLHMQEILMGSLKAPEEFKERADTLLNKINKLLGQESGGQEGAGSEKKSSGSQSTEGDDDVVDAPVPEKVDPKTLSSVEKIKAVQAVVKTKVDGDWGKNTSTKWIEWVADEETVKKIAALAKSKDIDVKKLQENRKLKRLELRSLLESFYLNEEDETAPPDADKGDEKSIEAPKELKDYIAKNKKSAVAVAKALGYEENLDGVYSLALDANKASTTVKDEKKKEDDNEDDLKRDDSWTANRNTDVINEDLNPLFPSVYDPKRKGYFASDVNLHKALTRSGNCPGLHVTFVNTYDEFIKRKPAAKKMGFKYLIQLHTTSGGYWPDILTSANGNNKVISKFSTFGDEQLSMGGGQTDGGTNDVYYDEANKTLCYDSSTGDYVLSQVLLTPDKSYIYYDPSYKYEKKANETKEANETKKLFETLKKYNII
jgi:hypothetical protein